jgi:hypothetical protein
MVVFRGPSVIKLVWSFRSCWLTCYSGYAWLYNIINKFVFNLVELLSYSLYCVASSCQVWLRFQVKYYLNLSGDWRTSCVLVSSTNKYSKLGKFCWVWILHQLLTLELVLVLVVIGNVYMPPQIGRRKWVLLHQVYKAVVCTEMVTADSVWCHCWLDFIITLCVLSCVHSLLWHCNIL